MAWRGQGWGRLPTGGISNDLQATRLVFASPHSNPPTPDPSPPLRFARGGRGTPRACRKSGSSRASCSGLLFDCLAFVIFAVAIVRAAVHRPPRPIFLQRFQTARALLAATRHTTVVRRACIFVDIYKRILLRSICWPLHGWNLAHMPSPKPRRAE